MRQAGTHHGLVAGGRQVLCGQQLLVAFLVQLAIGAAQAGDGGIVEQFTRQTLVADEQLQLVGCGKQHALLHHRFECGVFGLGRIEQRAVKTRLAGAQAVGLAAVGFIPLGLGDFLAVHDSHGRV